MLEELGFVNRLVRLYPALMNAGLFDEVGKMLQFNASNQDDGPFKGHWFTAHPDFEDMTSWNARIPYTFRGNRFQASVPATAIHDRKVRLFSCEPLEKTALRPAGLWFTMTFSAAMRKLYSNAILNPADKTE